MNYEAVYTTVCNRADMAATTTIRVRPETRARLNRLAQEDRVTAPELLERLVEREEHERLLTTMNREFAALREDAGRWADFQDGTTAWDATLSDVPADGV